MRTRTLRIRGEAYESARTYAEALIEACDKLKVEASRALIDTDDFPKLQKMPEIEFSIGWLHGCAEALGIAVEELWDAVVPEKKPSRSPNKKRPTR